MGLTPYLAYIQFKKKKKKKKQGNYLRFTLENTFNKLPLTCADILGKLVLTGNL